MDPCDPHFRFSHGFKSTVDCTLGMRTSRATALSAHHLEELGIALGGAALHLQVPLQTLPFAAGEIAFPCLIRVSTLPLLPQVKSRNTVYMITFMSGT